ncbi:MAG: hypothetical protein LRY27_03335 [Chitinophagales bacterium]|nr:hypothetical protein [Chitinophagales bacterium]
MNLLNNEQLNMLALHGYLVWDNVFDNNKALGLLNEAKHWEQEEAYKEAGIGKLENHHIQENFRSDKIKMDKPTGVPIKHTRISAFFRKTNAAV